MQRVWLERATREGWSVSEFKAEVRSSQRRKVVAGQAVLAGQYRVIYADPPWSYRQSNTSPEHGGRLRATTRRCRWTS